MKKIILFIISSAIAVSLLNACGPSEEEKRRQAQARQDSLERARQQQLAQQRQDSLEKARADSIAAAKKREEERIEFDSNGAYSIQVDAWRSEEKAQAQVEKWVERGYENAYVVQYGDEQTGNVWYRVRLGRVATQQMAQKLQDKLQKEYQAKSWVSMASDEQEENMSGEQ